MQNIFDGVPSRARARKTTMDGGGWGENISASRRAAEAVGHSRLPIFLHKTTWPDGRGGDAVCKLEGNAAGPGHAVAVRGWPNWQKGCTQMYSQKMQP
jgi:hypothetical protein